MKNVIKLRYAQNMFNPTNMDYPKKWDIEIYPNGDVNRIEYIPGSRKVKNKKSYKTTEERVRKLLNDIEECIDKANSNVMLVDDCSATLTIYYDFGHSETMDRELGNGETLIAGILGDFIYEVTNEI